MPDPERICKSGKAKNPPLTGSGFFSALGMFCRMLGVRLSRNLTVGVGDDFPNIAVLVLKVEAAPGVKVVDLHISA